MDNTVLTSLTGGALGPDLEKAPTGIPGLDQITEGGLPLGRVTLVAGSAGAGKTLLGMNFLVAGAREHGDPGVLVSFEEPTAKVARNVRSPGFDLDQLQRDGLLVVLSFPVDPSEIIAAGEFDFEPLFAIIDDAISRVGAKRVVLDTIEVLFGAFGDDTIVRSELGRLARWLEDRGVTTIVTGERGGTSLTRHGIEEYVTDCVIVLDHRVREEISTGIPRLDHMLSGGLFRGSTVMVSGSAGTGKTSLGAHLVDAACRRGERALLTLFEESPAQFLRNMRSVGLDLRPWVNAGLLRVWAAQPSAFGLETHLAVLARLVEEEGRDPVGGGARRDLCPRLRGPCPPRRCP